MPAAQKLPGSRQVGLEARRRPFEEVGQREREAVLAGFHEADSGPLRRHTRFTGRSEVVQRARLQERRLSKDLLAADGLGGALVLEVCEASRRLLARPRE